MAGTSSSSRFAVTCGLLRQYMREQQQQPGSLDGGAFRLPPLVGAEEVEDAVDGRTMLLFPTHAGTLQLSQDRPEKKQARKAPLTIFYEGRVLVLEDFPADKAEELMKLAGSGSSSTVASTRFLLRAALPVDLPPAMDGI
nr:unnamed protein product [Digitaria exilis]